MTITRSTLLQPTSSLADNPRVFDADIDRDGNTLFALGNDSIERLVFGDGTSCTLPSGLWTYRARLFSSDLTFIAARRVESEQEASGWLIDRRGQIVQSYCLGDGIEDLFGSENFLVASYFDQGVHGETPQASEGVAVFDLNGKFLWGWNGTIAKNGIADIDDCYSAIPLGNDHVAIFGYTEFQFAVLNLQTRDTEIHPTPASLHGARLSVKEGKAFFCGPYHMPDSIFAWQPGSADPCLIGSYSRSGQTKVRGLPYGRFIARSDSHVELITVQ